MCTWFLQGKCTKGDNCKYSHEEKHLAKARKTFKKWKKGGKGGRKGAKKAKGGGGKGRSVAAEGTGQQGGEEVQPEDVMPDFIEIDIDEMGDDLLEDE